MKITLTETFIDSITTLPNMIANQVLNTCRELMKLDNDAIEQYELPADAPQLLHDIVAAANAARPKLRHKPKAGLISRPNRLATLQLQHQLPPQLSLPNMPKLSICCSLTRPFTPPSTAS
ncbi:MAG: hypothetical protein K2M68_01905 [Muribaculaceae bacterium]|nr:hypothetical protein [Muribaculaceae bacterium]